MLKVRYDKYTNCLVKFVCLATLYYIQNRTIYHGVECKCEECNFIPTNDVTSGLDC